MHPYKQIYICKCSYCTENKTNNHIDVKEEMNMIAKNEVEQPVEMTCMDCKFFKGVATQSANKESVCTRWAGKWVKKFDKCNELEVKE
jgi:hypothetical protein